MTGQIILSPPELAQVRAILGEHLPSGVAVWVFGSRAGATPKPCSDLDLALEGPAALPLSMLAQLAEAFDESPLPWKVDLVDCRVVSPQFAAIIERDRMPLVWQGSA